MPDVFDIAEQPPDVFDIASGGGDVFDAAASFDPSQIKPTAYEAAELRYGKQDPYGAKDTEALQPFAHMLAPHGESSGPEMAADLTMMPLRAAALPFAAVPGLGQAAEEVASDVGNFPAMIAHYMGAPYNPPFKPGEPIFGVPQDSPPGTEPIQKYIDSVVKQGAEMLTPGTVGFMLAAKGLGAKAGEIPKSGLTAADFSKLDLADLQRALTENQIPPAETRPVAIEETAPPKPAAVPPESPAPAPEAKPVEVLPEQVPTKEVGATEPAPAATFKKGERVTSSAYGEGTVVAQMGDRVVVDFGTGNKFARPASELTRAEPPPQEKGPGAIGMGGATPSELSMPTIEDQISGGKLANKPEPVETPQPREPESKPILQALSDAGKTAVENVKGFVGYIAGKTLPRTTLKSQLLGELGARWISSKIAAKPKAEVFAADVLGDSGIDPVKFGAALTEDNLRSVRKAYADKAAQLFEEQKAAQAAKDDVKAQALETERQEALTAASNVRTLIGKEGSPFESEAAYQKFLTDPTTQEAIARHKDLWTAVVEPQYRSAMSIDPEVELPSRGDQTGARINLRAIREGDTVRDAVRTVGQGNLLGTLRRKSPFGVRATGTAEGYHSNYYDIMENTFGRQDEIANKNAFDRALVESGNAVIDSPGKTIMIGGREAVPFPLIKRAQTKMLYVNRALATEYRIGSNVEFSPSQNIIAKIFRGINTAAIAAGTDATTHVLNLGTALFSLPGVSSGLLNDAMLSAFGRADIPVVLTRLLMKSFQDNRAQLASLSEIGAMREHFEPTKTPVLRQLSQLIQWMDTNTRLVLDDAYRRMVQEGWVENSETARREFVNQVGQYNVRAQDWITGKMRQIGISPFVTAGKTFNALGIRSATLNPGVKASSPTAALALRANMLSKWVGTAAFVMSINYLLTHKKGGGVMGRPGTPLGYIDTGKDDELRRHVLIPIINMTGQGRALRVTGVRGAIEAKRLGLNNATAADSAFRDVVNAQIGPWAGPPVRFGVAATTGYQPAINVGRKFPIVPPSQSQHMSDFRNAVLEMNPVVAGIHQAQQPGSGGWVEALRSQAPRLTPLMGKPEEMVANYPKIVSMAQGKDFVEWIIHTARTVPREQRRAYVNEQIQKLPAQQREWARREMERRRVYVH